MDSLLANYVSSDEEEEEKAVAFVSNKPSPIYNKPPPPISNTNSKLSSLFSVLPPPKSSSSLFSSLPQPKSQATETKPKENPKKVVKFTLPLNPTLLNDDDEEEERKPTKDLSSNPTSSKGLSSMLPAPKNSLCLAPTSSSRKSAFESTGSSLNEESIPEIQKRTNLEQQGASFSAQEQYDNYQVEQGVNGYESYETYDSSLAASTNEYVDYSYTNAAHHESYAPNSWSNNIGLQVHEMERVGKRRKNDVPTEIVEVNQAELIKNRPKEHQAKATGIAFGPAYQPVSTSKGKPSKLHKRKHQIGSLYFDMRQKEAELAERRSKGLLTKAETHAKYGW